MNCQTPIQDRLAFRGEALFHYEKELIGRKCKISTYEPYAANDGDGAIVAIFDMGEEIRGGRYYAIEKCSYYKYFLIGFSLFSDGGCMTTNISKLETDDIETALTILGEYITTVTNGERWQIRL